MTGHPYRNLPGYAFWRRSVADPHPEEVDPVVSVPFNLAQSDRVATAGSCFAQHIARHLQDAGFGYLVTETPHPVIPRDLATEYNYGVFSARYGNVYTTRQLLQLFRRAYGKFHPREEVWQRGDGRWVDPFRPQISPDGYETSEEVLADRSHHLACVRRAFEEASIFVFTLGLTECWASREDGAVFPLCPGVAGGTFDPDRYCFLNLRAGEVTTDLLAFVDELRLVNPTVRVILTVSPVPLIATAAGRHALVSTTYSKAALRVAAEEVASARPDVAYFPSYEVITGPHTRGQYFAEDLRSVTEAGVAHVMRLFLHHFAGTASKPLAVPALTEQRSRATENEQVVRAVCDEEALDDSSMAPPSGNTAIYFGLGGNSERHTVAGWSSLENGFTWTTGHQARLALPAPLHPSEYTLCIAARPAVVPGRVPQQRGSIRINGIKCGEFALSSLGTIECRIPWNIIRGESSVDVVILLPDANRPCDSSDNPDARLLALAVSDVTLRPSTETAVAPRESAGATA